MKEGINGQAENEIFILTGCTASGKTEVAMRWAQRYNAEIISCDSMLFYRGMDIGTAKPSAEERGRVPHHLIDVADVAEPFSVAKYLPLARRAVADVAGRGKRILVAGGSGFYLMSFLRPVVDEVPVVPEIRDRVERVLAREGEKGLVKALQACNPEGTDRVDLSNVRRVFRALERCWASGRCLRDLEAEFRSLPAPFPQFRKKVCVLSRPRDEMIERIVRRSRYMVRNGLIEEVKGLLNQGLAGNPVAARAIGYRETLAYLDHPQSLEKLAGEIAANTIKLMKKQNTWFRHQLPPHRTVLAEEGSEPAPDELF